MTEQPEQKTHDPLILIVDDEPDIRKLIQFNLKRLGYSRLITAGNGKDALDKASRQVPDLVLLDIMMPGIDGFKVCESMKNNAKLKHIPIIIVSALSDIKNKANAYKCGADDYLAKPLDIITLAARTRSILETKRLREQVRELTDTKAISDNLFDYQHLFERLVAELEYCRKRTLPFSIIYLDIDYMKMINMEFGYKVGDSVLRGLRDIVNQKVGDNGVVLNSKSDKAVIMLPGINESKVHVVIDDILDKVRQIHLPIPEDKKAMLEAMSGRKKALTKVTLSMGVVTWDKAEGVLAQKLLGLVEQALKQAKDEGRDKKVQYQFYSRPSADGNHKIDKTIVKEYGRKDEI
jgi:diguanylate cyclase (GGDEF)-like protein